MNKWTTNFLVLFKKHAGTLIEQTRSHPQEKLEFKLKKQMDTFCFSPPTKLAEEGKWFLVVTSFETTKSIFIVSHEKNSFKFQQKDNGFLKEMENFLTS